MKRKSSRRLDLTFFSGERKRADHMHVPPVLPKMYLTSFSEMKHSYNTRFHPKKRFSFPKVRTITMGNSTYVTMDQEFEMVIRTHILRQFKNKRRELLARTKW